MRKPRAPIERDYRAEFPGYSQRDAGFVDANGARHCYFCGRFLPFLGGGVHGCPEPIARRVRRAGLKRIAAIRKGG